MRRSLVRPLGLNFCLILAFSGSAAAAAVHVGAEGVIGCPDHTAAATESAASLADAHHVNTTAIRAGVPPGLELGRDRTGESLRRPGARTARDELLGPRAHHAEARAASRARGIILSYLDFATALAEARAGTIAARSTAPPPPLDV